MNDTLRDILSRLDAVQEVSRGWKARCPAHDDSDPSLLVTAGDDVDVTVWCFAGCTWRQVANAIGIAPARLSGAEMHDCPECGAVQGAKLDRNEGDTGLWYCYECSAGGTGAQMYAAENDVPIAKAINEMQSGESLDASIKRKEKQVPRPRRDLSEEEWDRRAQLYFQMTPGELTMLDVYRRRRIGAQERRDREWFDRWCEKEKQLYDTVEQRVRAAAEA